MFFFIYTLKLKGIFVFKVTFIVHFPSICLPVVCCHNASQNDWIVSLPLTHCGPQGQHNSPKLQCRLALWTPILCLPHIGWSHVLLIGYIVQNVGQPGPNQTVKSFKSIQEHGHYDVGIFFFQLFSGLVWCITQSYWQRLGLESSLTLHYLAAGWH